MGTLLQDVRYGLRMLVKKPAFTIVAVLTLALGVGANTAIFSIVNAVLLRSLPFSHPDRLVKIAANNMGVGAQDIGFSVPELDDLKTSAGVFDQVSALQGGPTNLTGAEHPQHLELLEVSPNYFSMLGTSAHIGRVFGPEDETPGFAEAIVISDSLWASQFGRDPGVLGRKMQLDNDPYTIVGVLPPGFRHPGRTAATDVEIWTTCGFRADPYPKPDRSVRVVPGAMGLLKPEISLKQAQSRLDVFSSQLRAEYATNYPAGSGWSIEVVPLQESLVGNVRPMLLVLMGAVVLIILLASVNVANLLLARASGRQREMAVRLAMGASRSRMIRQMLTESVILSLVSGIVGVLTAMAALHFVQFLPARIPRLAEVQMDWTVLGFALLVSLLAGLGFGLVPALQSSKIEIAVAIREGARGSGTSGKTNRLRGLLIVSESALAVVLMVGAGLLLRTFWGLLQENPGFNPSRIVASNIYLPHPNNPDLDRYFNLETFNSFVRETVRRVSAIPGVDLAAMTSDLPVTHLSRRSAVKIEDRPDESGKGLFSEISSVTPEYFKVLQASLVRGRYFTEDEDAGKQPVAIIDESTARTYWPDRDPIGRRLSMTSFRKDDTSKPWCTVVGVMKDIKSDGLDQSGATHIYRPMYQFPGSRALSLGLMVRTSLSAASAEPLIRREVQTVDPNLPIFNVLTMNEVIDGSLALRRFSAELVGMFAVAALLLASVGIYGLLAYMVGQRAQEIGVRMALGAQRNDILKLVLTQGALLAGVGVCVGLTLAAGTAPMIAALLYGIRTHDPIVFLAVPLILLAVSFAASYIPARRATRISPIVALREG
ncbi:MAG TPA: ABC transporter permease [Candidatus Saccharimonadales bacterium]|nr:ABC transporter permease [Candidatus Saccharimonadales bacterium]